MKIIRHRRNTIDELRATPTTLGIEVDIRSFGERLVVHHDPMVEGEDFEAWLDHYRHGTLILNVKEEGLEEPVLASMRERRIEDFFFLDQSFPFLVRTARTGEKRCAVRVSEFEAIDTAISLASLIDWVWVDCFTKFPLEKAEADRLRAAGFRLCLVSPELQGRIAEQEITDMRRLLTERNITADAVCTKVPEQWA
ncbi:MAG: phosphatidylinositol-specific phospholipase C/glycerophosphodiester phosphodiesterase family protein [Pseudomonadota bacterium]